MPCRLVQVLADQGEEREDHQESQTSEAIHIPCQRSPRLTFSGAWMEPLLRLVRGGPSCRHGRTKPRLHALWALMENVMSKSYFDEQAEQVLAAAFAPASTALERHLWARLVKLEAAALRVLSDVDDDGVAEEADVAIQQLRAAC